MSNINRVQLPEGIAEGSYQIRNGQNENVQEDIHAPLGCHAHRSDNCVRKVFNSTDKLTEKQLRRITLKKLKITQARDTSITEENERITANNKKFVENKAPDCLASLLARISEADVRSLESLNLKNENILNLLVLPQPVLDDYEEKQYRILAQEMRIFRQFLIYSSYSDIKGSEKEKRMMTDIYKYIVKGIPPSKTSRFRKCIVEEVNDFFAAGLPDPELRQESRPILEKKVEYYKKNPATFNNLNMYTVARTLFHNFFFPELLKAFAIELTYERSYTHKKEEHLTWKHSLEYFRKAVFVHGILKYKSRIMYYYVFNSFPKEVSLADLLDYFDSLTEDV